MLHLYNLLKRLGPHYEIQLKYGLDNSLMITLIRFNLSDESVTKVGRCVTQEFMEQTDHYLDKIIFGELEEKLKKV